MGNEVRAAEKMVLEASGMKTPEQLGARTELLKQAAKLGNLEAEFELGWIYVAEGNLADAKEHFHISAQGGRPAPVAALGHIALEEGDLVYAELYYSMAVNIGLDVRFELARVMVRLGKTVPARSLLGQLAKENRPDAINEFGLFVAGEGKSRQAEKLWKRAAKLGNLDAKANLGRIVIDSNLKNRRYSSYLDDALDARHPGILNKFGSWLAENVGLEQAQNAWEVAAEVGDLDAHRNLGKLSRERGEESIALEWEKAAEQPNISETRRLLEKYGSPRWDSERVENLRSFELPENPEPEESPFWVSESQNPPFWLYLLLFISASALIRYLFL